MDRKCSRCNVSHGAQISALPDVGFQAPGRRGAKVCIAQGCADNLDDRRARLKVLDGLEVLDGHKGHDDFELVDRSQGT